MVTSSLQGIMIAGLWLLLPLPQQRPSGNAHADRETHMQTHEARRKPSASLEAPSPKPQSAHAVVPHHGESGDIEARASEEFRQFQRCFSSQKFVATAQAEVDVCSAETRPHWVERCKERTTDLIARIQNAERTAATCGDSHDGQAVGARYSAALTAAKLGDIEAQVCVVEGDFDQRVLRLTDEDRERHQVLAISYYEDGIRRGDWRVVEAMASGPQALSHMHGLRRLLTHGDDLTLYRMFRLLRMGAVDSYASYLDSRIQPLAEKIDPEKRANADAWVQEKFEKYFVNSPKLSEAQPICGEKF